MYITVSALLVYLLFSSGRQVPIQLSMYIAVHLSIKLTGLCPQAGRLGEGVQNNLSKRGLKLDARTVGEGGGSPKRYEQGPERGPRLKYNHRTEAEVEPGRGGGVEGANLLFDFCRIMGENENKNWTNGVRIPRAPRSVTVWLPK